MAVMIGPLLLIAALASPPMPTATAPASGFRPVGGATARASASVRIVSGFSFGRGRPANAPGAALRSTQLIDAEARTHPAKILEFQ